jgi:hypothetical protein
MRRIFIMLLITVLILVVAIFLITRGEIVTSTIQRGQGLASLILALLELFGLIVALALVFYLFYELVRYYFPRRFIFEGISNESDLVTAELKPMSLNKLALEELANQSQTLSSQLRQYVNNSSNNSGLVSYLSLPANAPLYIPPENLKDLRVYTVSSGFDILDRVKSAEGKVPQQYELIISIISFLGAIIPPPVVKINAYLQRLGSLPGKVGVTFEFVDVKKRQNTIHTFWQDEKTDKSELIQWYIELLCPAMRWLVLECFEQGIMLHIPLVNYIFKNYEKMRLATILYLLGILYNASAEEYKKQETFFSQIAIDHFHRASNANQDWYLPDLYLANLYSFEMIRNKEKREKLLKETLDLYGKALARATRMKKSVYTQLRIRIARTLAELALGIDTNNEELIKSASREVVEIEKEMDPADFDPDQPDCAAYLYNLATWYASAYDHYVAISNGEPREQARRYLAYSLARSRSLWDSCESDENFKSLREEGDLAMLKKELDERLSIRPDLARIMGDAFKNEIDTILERVDERLGRLSGATSGTP